MARRRLCATLLASLLIAACGGSSHSASSTSSADSTTASGTTGSATAAATTAQSTSTATVSAGPSTTTATTSSRPPEVPKNKAPKHSKPTAPDTNVRIPATFTIGPGAAITPPQISAPPKVTIELRLRNRDAKPHRVQLSVRHFSAVSVAPGALATTDVTGMRDGTYHLLVDGSVRAQILVGVVPGP